MRALTTLCAQNPLEIVLTPFGMFPVPNEGDPLWKNRINHLNMVADLDPVGALRTVTRCLNALYSL